MRSRVPFRFSRSPTHANRDVVPNSGQRGMAPDARATVDTWVITRRDYLAGTRNET